MSKFSGHTPSLEPPPTEENPVEISCRLLAFGFWIFLRVIPERESAFAFLASALAFFLSSSEGGPAVCIVIPQRSGGIRFLPTRHRVPFPFSCHLRRARSHASRAEGPLDTSLGRIPRVLKKSVLLKGTGFSRAASHAFAMRLQPAEARLFAMRRLFQQPSEGLSYTAPDERLIAQVPNPY